MRETECHLHLRQQKSGHLCQLKLSCIFVLISQFLDKRHHIIFRSQSSPLCFSGHFLLKHLHSVYSRIHNTDRVPLNNERNPVTARNPKNISNYPLEL